VENFQFRNKRNKLFEDTKTNIQKHIFIDGTFPLSQQKFNNTKNLKDYFPKIYLTNKNSYWTTNALEIGVVFM